MTPKSSTVPDLSQLFEIEELDIKRKALQERLDEVPKQREMMTGESARIDRSLKEKEQALAAKEKALQSLELDLKTSQTQEAEKRIKLNSVKTQKEYDALKSEIDHAQADRGNLEERILLLMDEISELKNFLQREKQSGCAKKKELAQKLDELAATEKTMQEDLKSLNDQALALVEKLPGDVHREYNRLRAAFANGQILAKLVPLDNTFSCSMCNSPVAHQIVIEIKKGQALHHCEICHRLLHI